MWLVAAAPEPARRRKANEKQVDTKGQLKAGGQGGWHREKAALQPDFELGANYLSAVTGGKRMSSPGPCSHRV